jgi:tetratricopeptide (TPR) repeat protein
LTHLGQLEEAETVLKQVLADEQRTKGDSFDTAHTLDKLAHVMVAKGDLSAAEDFTRMEVETLRRVTHDSHPTLSGALHNHAFLVWQNHGPARAVPIYRQALAGLRQALGNDHRDVADTSRDLGIALAALEGSAAEGEVHLREALRITNKLLGRESDEVAMMAYNLATACHKTGKIEESEALFRQVYDTMTANHRDTKSAKILTYLQRTCDSLSAICDATNRTEEAVQWRKRRDQFTPPDAAAENTSE